MQRAITSLFLALTVLAGASSWAAPRAYQGFVNVIPNQMMWGTMNVRYSTTTVGTPYIAALMTSLPDGSIEFAGRSDAGMNFSCLFWPDNPHYQNVRQMVTGISGPTYILVALKPNTSECSYVSIMNASYYQS